MDHTNNKTSSKPLEALEYPYQIFLITLYSLTACFAFVSNVLTILVLVRGKRCTRDLRKFLINLSVTDLLMAIFTIPFTYTNYMLGRWIFFSPMCAILNCAQLTTITVSIYTLVAIAIDRYMAIMHPLQKSISWFKQHRTLIVIFIWTLGILLGLSQLGVTEVVTFTHEGKKYTSCGERWTPETLEGRLYTIFIFSTTFALPMCSLCIIYATMGCKLLRYRGPHHESCQKIITPTISIRSPPNRNSLIPEESSRTIRSEPVLTEVVVVPSLDSNRANGAGNCTLSKEIRGKDSFRSNQNESNHLTHSVCYKSNNNHNKQHRISGKLGPSRSTSTFITSRKNVNGEGSSNQYHSYYDYDTEGNRIHTMNYHNWKLMNIRRNKVLKMLITIIGVFTICWLPIQIFNILIYFKPNFLDVDSDFKYYSFVGSYFFCHWISMAHSFMNPIIYSFMSKNFRSDMKTIFSNFRHYFLHDKRLTIGSGGSLGLSIHTNNHHNNNNDFGFNYNNSSTFRQQQQQQPEQLQETDIQEEQNGNSKRLQQTTRKQFVSPQQQSGYDTEIVHNNNGKEQDTSVVLIIPSSKSTKSPKRHRFSLPIIQTYLNRNGNRNDNNNNNNNKLNDRNLSIFSNQDDYKSGKIENSNETNNNKIFYDNNNSYSNNLNGNDRRLHRIDRDDQDDDEDSFACVIECDEQQPQHYKKRYPPSDYNVNVMLKNTSTNKNDDAGNHDSNSDNDNMKIPNYRHTII